MRPGGGGGAGAGDSGVRCGGGGTASGLLDGDPCSFPSPPDRRWRQVLPGDEGGSYGGTGGSASAAASMTSDGLVSFNGLEFFMDLQSGHIPDTGQCVYGQESQMESNMNWHHMEGDAYMGEDVDSDCEDGAEGESDNYDDFLVRCEGDTDVEDCFPTPTSAAPSQRRPTESAPPRQQPAPPGPTARKLPSVRGRGTRGWRQPRQHNPNSPNSRLYGYFTPGRDAQRREEEMQEGEE